MSDKRKGVEWSDLSEGRQSSVDAAAGRAMKVSEFISTGKKS